MFPVRNLFIFLLLASCTSSGADAQTETFDITTFAVPRSWERQTATDWVSYHTYDKAQNRMCRAWVYKGFGSSGNAQDDFTHFWQQIVATPYKLTRQPAPQTRKINGWTVLSASASVTDQGYPYTALLHVYSGNGVSVPFFFMYDNNAYLPDIQKLLASLNIKAKANTQPVAADNPPANGTSAAKEGFIVGTWINTSSVLSDFNDPYALSKGGYVTHQYIFQTNGTYTFASKSFSYMSDKLILAKENGTYQLAGNQLTLIPQNSVVETWSKKDNSDKWGSRLSSQPRRLEKTTYTVTHHYFSGIQQWNLVLQSGSPTARDGSFSGNTTFANAYYYVPASSNATPIEMP
jgi:hypothetical protein